MAAINDVWFITELVLDVGTSDTRGGRQNTFGAECGQHWSGLCCAARSRFPEIRWDFIWGSEAKQHFAVEGRGGKRQIVHCLRDSGLQRVWLSTHPSRGQF